MGRTLPTLRRAWPKDGPLAAICVQSVDVQCVLQFTLIHAAGCVLHRRTSRVIHRLKLFSFLLSGFHQRRLPVKPYGNNCQKNSRVTKKRLGAAPTQDRCSLNLCPTATEDSVKQGLARSHRQLDKKCCSKDGRASPAKAPDEPDKPGSDDPARQVPPE